MDRLWLGVEVNPAWASGNGHPSRLLLTSDATRGRERHGDRDTCTHGTTPHTGTTSVTHLRATWFRIGQTDPGKGTAHRHKGCTDSGMRVLFSFYDQRMTSGCPTVLITGNPGSGKTTILRNSADLGTRPSMRTTRWPAGRMAQRDGAGPGTASRRGDQADSAPVRLRHRDQLARHVGPLRSGLPAIHRCQNADRQTAVGGRQGAEPLAADHRRTTRVRGGDEGRGSNCARWPEVRD
jgi:hypothetical protein